MTSTKNSRYMVLGLLLIISIAFAISVTMTKTVKTTASQSFEEKFLKESYAVSLKQYFKRPGLRIMMTVKNDFTERELKSTLKLLKEYVTLSNMTEISNKYWNDQLYYVEVQIFKVNNQTQNSDYLLTTRYYLDSGKNIKNDYKLWQVETPR